MSGGSPLDSHMLVADLCEGASMEGIVSWIGQTLASSAIAILVFIGVRATGIGDAVPQLPARS
jgi:hypothetical protein